MKEREGGERLTILLISTPLTVLLPLLSLGLAKLAGRRVRCVGILGFGAEEFTLFQLVSLYSYISQRIKAEREEEHVNMHARIYEWEYKPSQHPYSPT